MTTPEGRTGVLAAWLVLCVALISTALVGAPAPEREAKKPYALIFGTVYLPDNRPAYGVKVKIRRADQKKTQWEHISDHAGEFAQRLPAGEANYVIWLETKGKQHQSEVTAHVHYDERVDVSLHLTE